MLRMQERQRAWAGLPVEIREWFSGPPPSQIPKSPPEAFDHHVPGPDDKPAESFVLGLLSLCKVEHLHVYSGLWEFSCKQNDGSWEVTPDVF